MGFLRKQGTVDEESFVFEDSLAPRNVRFRAGEERKRSEAFGLRKLARPHCSLLGRAKEFFQQTHGLSFVHLNQHGQLCTRLSQEHCVSRAAEDAGLVVLLELLRFQSCPLSRWLQVIPDRRCTSILSNNSSDVGSIEGQPADGACGLMSECW